MVPCKFFMRVFCVAAVCLMSGQAALAQNNATLTNKKSASAAATDAALRDVAGSQAMQIYDATMVNCMKDVMGFDPAEMAKTGDKRALDMDRGKLMKIDACVTKRGFSSTFDDENTQNGNPGNSKDPEERLVGEIIEIQQQIDAAQRAAVPVSPQPTMIPVQGGEPPMAAPPVTALPEKIEEIPAPAAAPARAPRKQNQFWVKPKT